MKRLLLIIVSVLSIQFINAQDANDALRLGMPGLGSSARALGMGNAYIGLSDDASAAYFNPAGFGLMKKLEFSGGLDFNQFENNATLLGVSTNGSNTETNLDRLSFAFPFPTMRGSLVFGLSYHKTKDFTGALKFDAFNPNSSYIGYLTGLRSDIPYYLYLSDTLGNSDVTILDKDLNQSGNVLNSGGMNNWTLSGAIEVYRNLFVGLNVNIISGSYESNNDYYEDDSKNIYQGETVPGYPTTTDFQTFYLNRIIEWDLSGWDAKLGMIYQFSNLSRVGLTIQFPKTITVKEKFIVNGYSEFADDRVDLVSEDYSDEVQYDVITPFELSGGFSLNLMGLIVSAEGSLIDYSQLKFDNAEGLDDQYIGSVNKDIKDQLAAVVNYNVGAEYTIPQLGVRIRGGYFVQGSGYKNDKPEFDRKYVTAGLGYLADETIGIDLGFAHGWWSDVGDNYSSGLSRTTQEISFNKFILSGTYRF